MPKTMSKTAYEIESELKVSAADRTGFGGRPELINFYVESTEDLSALPVLDKLDVDALRCGKVIPVVTIPGDSDAATTVASVDVTENDVTFKVGENSFVYTIADKTWALGASESEPEPDPDPVPGGGT